MKPEVGISQIAVSIPEDFFLSTGIAKLRGLPPEYPRKGLGVVSSRIPYRESLEDLAVKALKKIDYDDVERVYFGTESDYDSSKPTLAVGTINKRLRLKLVPFSLKFACAAGTQALISACEYTVAHGGKPAIAVMADRSIYGENHPKGEVTQGCAVIVVRTEIDPKLLKVDYLRSAQYGDDRDGFKVPLHSAPFPEVKGDLSTVSYLESCKKALEEWIRKNPEFIPILNQINYFIFHVPFPKMVIWLSADLWRREKYKENPFPTIEDCLKDTTLYSEYKKEKIDKIRALPEFQKFFNQKIKPGLRYNEEIINAYVASMYVSLLAVLEQARKNETVLMNSFGSGSAAITLLVEVVDRYQSDLSEQLQRGTELTEAQYEGYREKTLKEVRGTQPH